MDSINVVVERFNEVITDIEKEEQYDVIYNRYLLRSYFDEAGITGDLDKEEVLNIRINEALIYAKSVADVDSRTERFCAILTFSVLLGAAFSLIYGILRTEKYIEGRWNFNKFL